MYSNTIIGARKGPDRSCVLNLVLILSGLISVQTSALVNYYSRRVLRVLLRARFSAQTFSAHLINCAYLINLIN
jgi:hypothetical protein